MVTLLMLCVDSCCVFTAVVCDESTTIYVPTTLVNTIEGVSLPCIRVCNDNNACTDNTCAPSTGCISSRITCDDDNSCTNDMCDSSSGCEYTPFSCDNGDVCTNGEQKLKLSSAQIICSQVQKIKE